MSEAQLAHVERRLAVCPSIRGTDLFGELQRDGAYAPRLSADPGSTGTREQLDYQEYGNGLDSRVAMIAMHAILGRVRPTACFAS